MVRVLLVLFTLLALIAIALTLVAALGGSENLLLVAMKDDGFYYLTLARNIASGYGATFDRLGPTNGFHPLWALMLTPIYWFKYSSPYTPVRIAILLAVLVHIAAGFAVGRAARRLTDPLSGRIAGLFYIANPLGLYLVVSGMESPVVGLLVALVAAESIRLRSSPVPAGHSAWVRLGVLSGLCMLARTDTVILVGIVLAGLLLLPAIGGARPFPTRMRASFGAGAVAALIVSPWIVWNLARFGSIVQVSASAHHLHALSSRAPGDPAGPARLLEIGGSVSSRVMTAVAGRTGLPQSAILIGVLGVLAVVSWWIISLLRSRDDRRSLVKQIRLFDAPLLYVIVYLGAAFFILGHIRSWYIAGPLAVGGILFSMPLQHILRAEPGSMGKRLASGLIVGGIVIATLPLGLVFGREIIENSRSLPCWREAADWVSENTAVGERVASFNSGTFGYLSERTVVNLDCVVNNRALPALADRRLIAFLRENQVEVVIDDPRYAVPYFAAYAEPGWQSAVPPIDTLRSGLVVYEVR